MKPHIIIFILLLLLSFTAAASAQDTDTLVIYFSRIGEQYGVGVIEKGNTEIAAEMIDSGKANAVLDKFALLSKE